MAAHWQSYNSVRRWSSIMTRDTGGAVQCPSLRLCALLGLLATSLRSPPDGGRRLRADALFWGEVPAECLACSQEHAAERTISGLWGLIGKIVDIFEPMECDNNFSSCGYDRKLTDLPPPSGPIGSLGRVDIVGSRPR